MPLKLTSHPYNLPFEYPFKISKAEKTHQPGLAVSLYFMGFKGYGEAPAISYYDISVEKMIACLEQKKRLVEQFAFSDPERYWHYLHHLFHENNFLVCALDMAGWDLFGKMKRKPLHQIWQLDTTKIPQTDYTIGIDTIDKMVAKMRNKPWPVYKIKVGVDGDVDRVAALRKETNAVFRVDANGGWNLEQALERIPKMAELGVELVEQPLAKEDWDGMRKLYAASPLPLIADEACVEEEDVAKCADFFHGVNIKLTKCSGITPARRMIKEARDKNLKVMIGCMNETSIGSAAIAQLSPLADYLDMDGTLLITEDLGSGISFDDAGRPIISEKPGLGIDVHAF